MMPSTREEYLAGIRSALPSDKQFVKDTFAPLSDLRAWRADQVLPDRGDSLCNWLGPREGVGPTDLTLVLGETPGPRRVARGNRHADDHMLTMAATSDVVAGLSSVVNLLRTTDAAGGQVDFNAVVDEWPQTPGFAHRRNLLVIGTGEVNVIGTFLHGLVHDFYFGEREWPPHPTSLGTQFDVDSHTFHRDPGGGRIDHLGGVFLLKNPWALHRNILWVAGLTGRATFAGCHQLAAHWSDHRDSAERSIGVIFHVDEAHGSDDIAPIAWLRMVPEARWEWVSPSLAPEPMPARTYCNKNTVFISHGHSPIWVLLTHFLDGLKLRWQHFDGIPIAGITTTERLNELLNTSDFALIVMTGEDQHKDKIFHARENVIHEAGLFQGRLGTKRTIILLEEGCVPFSNIDGLTRISFPRGNIKASFHEIHEVLKREGFITP